MNSISVYERSGGHNTITTAGNPDRGTPPQFTFHVQNLSGRAVELFQPANWPPVHNVGAVIDTIQHRRTERAPAADPERALHGLQ